MNGQDEARWPQKPVDPWKTIKLLKKKVSKNSLDLSFENIKSQMEENEELQEALVELERLIKMQFDAFKHLPIGFHLKMADNLSKLADLPFILPHFPSQPSKNIVDAYIKYRKLENETHSESEKMELFKKESNNVRVVLETLKAWKQEVEIFTESVAAFKSYHQESMSDGQNLKVTNMEVRAKESLPQINAKIAEKEKELNTFVMSFDNFHNKLKKDQKFEGMPQLEVRKSIREIWNNTDEVIRRCFTEPPRQCKIECREVEEVTIEDDPTEQPSSSQLPVSVIQKRKLLETATEKSAQNESTPKRGRKLSKKMEQNVAEKQGEDVNSNAQNLANNPTRTVLKSILKKSPKPNVAQEQGEDDNANAQNLANNSNRFVLKSILKKSPNVMKH